MVDSVDDGQQWLLMVVFHQQQKTLVDIGSSTVHSDQQRLMSVKLLINMMLVAE